MPVANNEKFDMRAEESKAYELWTLSAPTFVDPYPTLRYQSCRHGLLSFFSE